MKSIYTKIPYYNNEKEFRELYNWMNENIGPYFEKWDWFVLGRYTEIIVWNNEDALLVALRWA